MEETMRVAICGDICPTQHTQRLFADGDARALFGGALDVLRGCDRVVVNLECALTESGAPIRKIGPNLRAHPAAAKTLAQAGVTDCAISNNHILDYGVRGLRDTVRALEDNGIRWTGAGDSEDDARRDLLMEGEGRKIALIAVCEHEYTCALPDRAGARAWDPYGTMEDIRAAAGEADHVVVLYHGGKEQCEFPSPRLRKLCRAMARAGAGAVLCQHSHCIGCYERFEDCHILYGQGNFHFIEDVENPHPQWRGGLIVRLDIGREMEIECIPVVVRGNGIDLARGGEREEILGAFHARGEMLKDGRWLDGWRAFCRARYDAYRNTVADAFLPGSTDRQNQYFAHYLDCEAHTDVWRELFPTWNQSNE